jgi:hypothetical protein
MRALVPRPRRLALACAMISAATLGTVSASAASASDTSTVTSAKPAASRHAEPPKGTALAVAYKPTAKAPGDVNTANGEFAACMRGQGQKYFPDFHASKDADGHVRLDVKVVGKDFDPTSKEYKNALDACAPILAKAGISFPAAPDLPPLPDPGKKPPFPHKEHTGQKGHTEHKETGQPGEPDLPSLSSGIESA